MLLAVPSSSLPALQAPSVWVERQAYLMGTLLHVTVSAPSRTAGIEAIEAVFQEVSRVEDLLSSWRDDSEMSRVNSAGRGESLQVSAEFFALLREVEVWVERTEAAFDPAVGPLIDAWDLRGAGRQPPAAELAAALSLSGLDGYRLEELGGSVVPLRDGNWITAGGFGKGAALRAARRALEQAGIESASLDFGGQITALGSPPDEDAWTVALAHPSLRGQEALRIRLSDASAATSAASERFVEIEGERFGHVIDPRSGRPVAAWGSVTVVAEDPLIADVLSTALFVMGHEAGRLWAESHGAVAALFLREENGGVMASWTPAMKDWLIGSVQSVAIDAEKRSPTYGRGGH